MEAWFWKEWISCEGVAGGKSGPVHKAFWGSGVILRAARRH